MPLAISGIADFTDISSSNVDLDSRCYVFEGRISNTESVEISTNYSATEVAQKNKLDSALALRQIEDICQFVESLLAQEIQFRPVEESSHRSDLIATLSSTEQREGVSISLSRTLKPLVEENWDIIKTHQLRWVNIDAELVLDSFQISDEDLARCDTGSLLVLPSSYRSQWCCRLVNKELDCNKPCVLNLTERSLSLSAETEKYQVENNSQLISIEVTLDQLLSVSPISLFKRKDQTDVSENTETTTCVQLPQFEGMMVSCILSNHKEFSGSLVRLGDGFGVYLEERL